MSRGGRLSGCAAWLAPFAALALCGIAGCDSRRPARVRPDVLLLVVDTLRASHLGLYGYPRDTSPALDRLASESTVFDEVVAASSWTLPSVGSLLTSTYPSVHGLTARFENRKVMSIRPGLDSLPQAFRDAGYRTAAVITNPWMNTADHGLQEGFDDYRDMTGASAEAVNALAREILSRDDPAPVFLYLHYMDVHGPYDAVARTGRDLGPVPAAYRRSLTKAEDRALPPYLRRPQLRDLGDYVDAYDHGIRAWDDALAHLVDWLRAEGRIDRVVISVLSDHGEEFLEHGGWNHGKTVYQEQLSIPWILRVPGSPSRRVDDRVVSLIDVAPTLLALAGVPPGSRMSGVDVLAASPDEEPRSILAETGIRLGGVPDESNRAVSIQRGHQKMIVKGSRSFCFDLERDPRELDPIAGEEPCDGAAFAALEAWRRDAVRAAEGLGEASAKELPADQAEALRRLGYGE